MFPGENGCTLQELLTAVEELKALGDAVKTRQVHLRQTIRLLRLSVIDDGQTVPFMFEFNWSIHSISEMNDAIRGRTLHEAYEVLDIISAANKYGFKLELAKGKDLYETQ